MSHGSGEEENYWPGYVDALTSMVQVLAFVMMLLALAVYVLSQNVSRSAVVAISKAVEIKPDANATVEHLLGDVLAEVARLKALAANATARGDTPALPMLRPTETARRQLKSATPRAPRKRRAPKTAPRPPQRRTRAAPPPRNRRLLVSKPTMRMGWGRIQRSRALCSRVIRNQDLPAARR